VGEGETAGGQGSHSLRGKGQEGENPGGHGLLSGLLKLVVLDDVTLEFQGFNPVFNLEKEGRR